MTENSFSGIWSRVKEELNAKGIDLEAECCGPSSGSPLKIVCMAGGLSDSIKEMGQTTRDQVVMVRVDTETCGKLDHWGETGAFKSRSEAAALFIRDGLQVHASELAELDEALAGVEDARDRLRQKVREMFHMDNEADAESDDG